MPQALRQLSLNVTSQSNSRSTTSHSITAMEQRQFHEGTSSIFPTNPEEFDSDDRISFSKLDNKFLLVQEDGSEFEFDEAIKRWIPVLDEALLEVQQRAYMVS